ncbi:hypothetical protein ACFYVR_25190 [Rhodococcus sp. NPDC003318]|uniref:hypothetical protein n=1 Tax=Rhodococcus sp. NPDC003318 TaxID=3364503 RepID=UPI00369B3AD2
MDSSIFEADEPAPRGGLDSPRIGPPPSFHDETRRTIAMILVILLALVTIGSLASFIAGWLEVGELKELGIILTPVLTLTGTAVGFYFGANNKD